MQYGIQKMSFAAMSAPKETFNLKPAPIITSAVTGVAGVGVAHAADQSKLLFGLLGAVLGYAGYLVYEKIRYSV